MWVTLIAALGFAGAGFECGGVVVALRGARGFGNRLTGRDKREISGIGGGLWIANGEVPFSFSP